MSTLFTDDIPLPVGQDDAGDVFVAAAAALAAAGPTHSDTDPGSLPGTHRLGAEGPSSEVGTRLRKGRGAPVHLGGYVVTRYLASGAMGDVYVATRTADGAQVALKVLRHASACNLVRFKREFRLAEAVAHRNLMHLCELGSEGQEWFLAMELVSGPSFLGYVTGGTAGAMTPAGATIRIDRGRELLAGIADEVTVEEPSGPAGTAAVARHLDEGRLRAALRELTLGVLALHDAGKLHLDLNPSNVKVTAEGRVVILDFGLIRDQGPAPCADRQGHPCGTPPYMAPEQASGTSSRASDWYAVGVMLYEALTGDVPFGGVGVHAMLSAKRRRDPPPPESLVDGLPEDLTRLAMALLDRDPSRRPDGRAILARLDAVSPGGASAPVDRAPLDGFFVGRPRELASLDEALAAVARGAPRALHLRGPAGSGKTALVQRFLEQLRAGARATVLEARCHERESIPWSGLDPLVDALAAHLRALPAPALDGLHVPDVHELARLFPVLQGIFDTPASTRPPPHDLATRDQRALVALRVLVARLAATAPLVLHLDDADASDLPSLRWLADLIGSASSAGERLAILLVLGYRSDELTPTATLDALQKLRERRGHDVIELGPLDRSEAVALALSRLPRDAFTQETAEAIARESEGSPALILALVRHTDPDSSAGVARDPARTSLARVFEARLAQLSAEARRLFEVVALAAQPLPVHQVLAIGGTARDEGVAVLRQLCAARLLRHGGSGDRVVLAPAHERLRAVVRDALSPAEQQEIHLAVARALAGSNAAVPEVLAHHFQAGGVPAEARLHTERAADAAARAGDFDRAASLYQQAIALDPRGPHLDRPLVQRRADALAAAGRRDEAVTAYLAAADGAPGVLALDLTRRASEQHFSGGDARTGLSLLQPVLARLGVPYPRSPIVAQLGLGRELMRLDLRGTDFVRRGERSIPAEQRARIAASWAAGRGLASTDALRAPLFFLEALHLALDAGDVARAGCGLAYVGSFLLDGGSRRSRDRARAMLASAADLPEDLDDPTPALFVLICRAHADLGAGRFDQARAKAERAEGRLRALGAGLGWERALARATQLDALTALGEVAEHARCVQAWVDEAAVDPCAPASVPVALHAAWAHLAADAPERACRQLREVALPPAAGTTAPSQLRALALTVACHTYEGRPDEALTAVEASLRAFDAAGLLRPRAARIEALSLEGLTATAAADRGHPGGGGLLRTARRIATELTREACPPAEAAAALLRANVARIENRMDVSLQELRAAARFHGASRMNVARACAQRREGLLVGGRAGAALVIEADASLRALGIVDPERWMRVVTGLAR